MPDGSNFAPPTGLIGPNAILQLVGPVTQVLGPHAMDDLLEVAGTTMPSGDEMIDEGAVARVHQALHRLYPDEVHDIARAAGALTADYIIANRIPRFAQVMLRALPTFLGARLLTKAIQKHAWTFCGSGTLSVRYGDPILFEISDNPVMRGITAQIPICFWHSAVFEELFSKLLGIQYSAHEVDCCALGGMSCRFEVMQT